MEMLNPIRPNLHTPNHGTSGSIATAAAAFAKIVQSLRRDVANDLQRTEKCWYPVGDEKQTHTPDDALSFLFPVVLDLRNVYVWQKIVDKIEEACA